MSKDLPRPVLDVLVVCSGNMCRSPMAAAQLRRTLQEMKVPGIGVRSAGTIAQAGRPASPEAVEVAEAHGLDITHHRTTPLTPDLLRRADIVLVMEKERHVDAVRALDPGAIGKTFVLSEFADDGPEKGETVQDPIGTTYAFYELIFKKMDAMLDNFVALLKEQNTNDNTE